MIEVETKPVEEVKKVKRKKSVKVRRSSPPPSTDPDPTLTTLTPASRLHAHLVVVCTLNCGNRSELCVATCVQKSIVKFLKGSSSSSTSTSTKEEKPQKKEKSVSFKMDEGQVATLGASAVEAVEAAIAPVAAADEASATETVKKVEKREVDKKKLIFAATVIGMACKLIVDKAAEAKKKAAIPPPPQYTTFCSSEGAAKKLGLPQVCFRVPKKFGKSRVPTHPRHPGTKPLPSSLT